MIQKRYNKLERKNVMYLVIKKRKMFDTNYYYVEHSTASSSDAHSLQMAKTQEAKIKKELMELEFQYNMKIKALESESKNLIEDKRQETASKKFESAGNDELGTGLNMNEF